MSGGAAGSGLETLLLAGTRKGLFRALSSGGGAAWTVRPPTLDGYEIFHLATDGLDTVYAAVNHPVWGSRVFRSRDRGASWAPAPGRLAFPAEAERRVEAIWHLASGGPERPEYLYAGVQPAALFLSRDAGASWEWLPALEEHPSHRQWQPAKGGLFVHSIQLDPREHRRLYVAVSAGGCYRSEDGGESWRTINRGVRAGYLADPRAESGHNPHSLRLHPAAPDRLYRQDHHGVYRSDDRGERWTEITHGLPGEFGYVVGLDPLNPDRCWVVPEESSHLRCTCGGRLRVYETRDAGETWVARTEGLPQQHAYVSVLREGLCTGGGSPCGVHFGTSTGHLFSSPDGTGWTMIAGFLPAVLSLLALPEAAP
ncbi:MAG: WD40/YVTN/BNR-like repeat-containing protein [Gemmatimonadota bacterium]